LKVLRTRGGKRERGSLVVAVMVAVEVWRCVSGAEEEYKDSCRNMN
jgi:hypothetical protein